MRRHRKAKPARESVTRSDCCLGKTAVMEDAFSLESSRQANRSMEKKRVEAHRPHQAVVWRERDSVRVTKIGKLVCYRSSLF